MKLGLHEARTPATVQIERSCSLRVRYPSIESARVTRVRVFVQSTLIGQLTTIGSAANWSAKYVVSLQSSDPGQFRSDSVGIKGNFARF